MYINFTYKFFLSLIFLEGSFFYTKASEVAVEVEEIRFLQEKRSLPAYIVGILSLLGGFRVPMNVLINSLEDNLENKKVAVLSIVRNLEHKKIIKTEIYEGEILVSLILDTQLRESIITNKELIKGVIRTLTQAFNKDWEHLIAYVRDNPSIIEITENFFKCLEILYEKPETVLPIQIHLLEYYMYATREHSKAMELMNKIERNKAFKTLTPELRALFISNKGNIISTHFSANRELLEQTLKELEESFNIFYQQRNYGEALRILSCWAQAHIIGGNLEKAISLLQQGENLVSKIDRDRYKAIFYYIYSWCCLESGDYENSVMYADKASLHLHPHLPTPLHFFTKNLKADALYNLNNFKEAYQAALNSVKEARNFNSDRAADWKGEALVVMSKCALQSGNIERAEKYINEAEQEYLDFFHSPDKHIDQAALKTVKGKILLEKGDLLAAKRCCEEGIRIYSKLLGKNSWFDEQGILYELLATIGTKMEDLSLVLHYWKAHKNQFGPNHPRTLKIKALLT
jgi:tetratricopeptide (TPR) repeat protein